MAEFRGKLYYSPRRGIAQLLSGEKPVNLDDILLKLDGKEIVIQEAGEYPHVGDFIQETARLKEEIAQLKAGLVLNASEEAEDNA